MHPTSFARLSSPTVGFNLTRAQHPRRAASSRPSRPLIRAHFQPLRSASPYRLFDPNLLDRLHEPLTRFAE